MNKELIAENTYLLSDFDMCCMYLLIGSKSALLIDTGLGYKGFRKNIEELIGGKKLTVALTHGHVDHIGGASQFDEVYIHPDDLELESKMKKKTRLLFITENFILVPSVILHFKDLYKIKKEKKTNFKELKDKQVFDLGDRKVTFYHTPGHTKGSGCFFDDKTKILFSGDMVSTSAMIYFPESTDMSVYKESLEKIKKLSENAVNLYGGHNFITPVPDGVLKNLIKLTGKLTKAGKNDKKGMGMKFRLFPFTALIYSKDKI